MQRVSAGEGSFIDEVKAALIGRGDGDTQVLDVDVTQRENALSELAWRVTLFLPKPVGASWDVEKTVVIKGLAREIVDAAAQRYGEGLDGSTVAVVSTHDAPESETAPTASLHPDAGLPFRHGRYSPAVAWSRRYSRR